MTGTPRVSRYSRVLGRSSRALAPAQTTATGVRASSSRSAEISKDSEAPRCTPPMPPVAKTPIPLRWAQIMVAATVVEPCSPRAIAKGRSARLSLRTSFAWPSQSSSVSVRPVRICPPMTAMVAGSAPAARTSASTARAVATLSGYGIPCVMIVLSRATGGRRSGKTGLQEFTAEVGHRGKFGFDGDRGSGQAPADRVDQGFAVPQAIEGAGDQGIARAGDIAWRGGKRGKRSVLPVSPDRNTELAGGDDTGRCAGDRSSGTALGQNGGLRGVAEEQGDTREQGNQLVRFGNGDGVDCDRDFAGSIEQPRDRLAGE